MPQSKGHKKGTPKPPIYLSIAVEVWAFVEARPSCTFNQIYEHMLASGYLMGETYIRDHIRALVKAGAILEDRIEGRYKVYVSAIASVK